jgi:hypothetical protein
MADSVAKKIPVDRVVFSPNGDVINESAKLFA